MPFNIKWSRFSINLKRNIVKLYLKFNETFRELGLEEFYEKLIKTEQSSSWGSRQLPSS